MGYTAKQIASREAGLCICCREPRPSGLKNYCERCQRTRTFKNRLRREEFKRKGRCIDCGGRPKPECVRCQRCTDRGLGRRLKRCHRLVELLSFCIDRLEALSAGDHTPVPGEKLDELHKAVRRYRK